MGTAQRRVSRKSRLRAALHNLNARNRLVLKALFFARTFFNGLLLLGTIKDIEFIGGRGGGWVVDFGFDVVWLNAHAAQIFVCFLLLPRVTHFFKLPHRKSFLLSCRNNKSTRRLQEIEKRFNIRVLSVRSLCASLFYNVVKKALISYVYPLSFGETSCISYEDWSWKQSRWYSKHFSGIKSWFSEGCFGHWELRTGKQVNRSFRPGYLAPYFPVI